MIGVSSSFESKKMSIDRELASYLEGRGGAVSRLLDAARYALLGPGKRLRPLLVIICCEALNGNERSALPAACAFEMIHAYSLIHDDLPCMDNDDFRRGIPTLHRAFSEGLAVLTGDFLLTKAFEIVAKTALLTPQQKIETITVLAERAGEAGMIGGQVMDIESENTAISLPLLQNIHKGKTGALIAGACECGGIAAGAPEEVVFLLHDIGMLLGTAFQIIDDVLDVTASQQKHGKMAASDLRNAKTTYVTLLGVEGAKMAAEELFIESCKKMELLPGAIGPLRTLAEQLVYRKI